MIESLVQFKSFAELSNEDIIIHRDVIPSLIYLEEDSYSLAEFIHELEPNRSYLVVPMSHFLGLKGDQKRFLIDWIRELNFNGTETRERILEVVRMYQIPTRQSIATKVADKLEAAPSFELFDNLESAARDMLGSIQKDAPNKKLEKLLDDEGYSIALEGYKKSPEHHFNLPEDWSTTNYIMARDISGSMADDSRYENANDACNMMIQVLRSKPNTGEIYNLFYAVEVQELPLSTKVGIAPEGDTSLGNAIREISRLARLNPKTPHFATLFTDGMANVAEDKNSAKDAQAYALEMVRGLPKNTVLMLILFAHKNPQYPNDFLRYLQAYQEIVDTAQNAFARVLVPNRDGRFLPFLAFSAMRRVRGVR